MLYGLDATNLRKFFCNIWAAFGGKAPGKGLTRKMINIQCETAKAGFYIVQATCNIKTIKGRIYNDHMYYSNIEMIEDRFCNVPFTCNGKSAKGRFCHVQLTCNGRNSKGRISQDLSHMQLKESKQLYRKVQPNLQKQSSYTCELKAM